MGASAQAERDLRRVCLVSGGTGGHLMPALVLARSLQQSGQAPLLITEGRDVERELVRRELPDVAAVEVPRSGRSPLALPWWLLRATSSARGLLRRHQIAGVISTGGRASVPVAMAAKSLSLPVFLLEQNAVTGRANRWLMPIARRMYLGLPGAGERHPGGLYTGTPLRQGFGRVDRGEARRSLGLGSDAPVVLVTGGSQGARVLNELVPQALQQVRHKVQVLHLSGLGNDAAVRDRYAGAGRETVAHVRAVAADMDRLFAAADLVICRGGGTTVAELMAVGRPALIVPYPHHKDRQQFHNARVLERVGAATICEEHDCDVATLAARIAGLLDEPSRLRAMADQGRKLRRLDAADAILADVREVIGEAQRGRRGLVDGPQPASDAGSRNAQASPQRRGGVA